MRAMSSPAFIDHSPHAMFNPSRDEVRRFFIDTWRKQRAGQILTPLDLEREFGLTQGNIFQGELSLEQLFFLRPVPGWAYYRTPVDNLYMCGSATHPGGGIMGANGRIASQVILKEWSHALRAHRTKSGSSRSTEAASKAAH